MSRRVSASRRSSSRMSPAISASTSARGGSRQFKAFGMGREVSTARCGRLTRWRLRFGASKHVNARQSKPVHLLIVAEPAAERPDEPQHQTNRTECGANLRFEDELEFRRGNRAAAAVEKIVG